MKLSGVLNNQRRESSRLVEELKKLEGQKPQVDAEFEKLDDE